eukprot:2952582-Prymnesium_polylepis.1
MGISRVRTRATPHPTPVGPRTHHAPHASARAVGRSRCGAVRAAGPFALRGRSRCGLTDAPRAVSTSPEGERPERQVLKRLGPQRRRVRPAANRAVRPRVGSPFVRRRLRVRVAPREQRRCDRALLRPREARRTAAARVQPRP